MVNVCSGNENLGPFDCLPLAVTAMGCVNIMKAEKVAKATKDIRWESILLYIRYCLSRFFVENRMVERKDRPFYRLGRK